MVTTNECVKRILELEKQAALLSASQKTPKQKDSEKKKISNKISFIRRVVKYLESNPSEVFVNMELARVNSLLAKINSDFERWKEISAPQGLQWDEYKKMYDKLHGVSAIKQQIKTLEYIVG